MAENNVNLTSAGKASFPDLHTFGTSAAYPENAAAELLFGGSVEFSFGDAAVFRGMMGLLPFGMPVMVPHLPGQPLGSRLNLLTAISRAGFDPVPHVSARGTASTKQLEEFLKTASRTAGVHRILLVGGDHAQAAGPFEDAQAVLASGVLGEAGVREVGFAAYPEGHPAIPSDTLFRALLEKLEMAGQSGLGAHVITQFSLLPTRIVEFCARFAESAPGVPVYAGLPGPSTGRQLLHFSRHCGVGASLAAVGEVGVKVAQVEDHFKPEQQLGLLAHYCGHHPGCCLVGVHVFSFGGFAKTADWIAGHKRNTG